ncbi:MAG TPA: hypothetical protein C5S51_09340 [Methanosarcinaceae archaeon]|nr:hypothetical protein [Methanosarcinaceae archaeon]
MNSVVNSTLKRLVVSTSIVFIGSIVGMLLAFANRLIIIRSLTVEEFGIYSIGLTLLNILVLISALGLQVGTTREIAYFKAQNSMDKIWNVIISAIQIAIVSSLFFLLVAELSVDFILPIFDINGLNSISKIFFIALPFSVLTSIILTIFRGFGIMKENIIFNNILLFVFEIMYLFIAIVFDLSLRSFVYAHVLAIISVFIVLALYTSRHSLILKIKVDKYEPMRKSLLLFSLPLMGLAMVPIIITTTDTLMLGYFMNADAVGIYNGAVPFASIISAILSSLMFLYVPLMTQLYSKKQNDEIKRTYSIITKWIFSISLPIFFIVFFFPDSVLNAFFGFRYIQADIVLQLLTLGFFTNTILGPNGITLTIMGKTKIVFVFALLRLIINISLNVLLIPLMGFVGAAIASAIALISINILNSMKLYSISKIQPFSKNYLKPIMLSFIVAFTVSTLFRTSTYLLPIWMLIVLFVVFAGVYCLSILLTKSFDDEDLMLMLEVEKKLGINLLSAKKIMRRFI